MEGKRVQLDFSSGTYYLTLIYQKPKGLRQIWDHVRKALDKKNPDMLCPVLCDLF